MYRKPQKPLEKRPCPHCGSPTSHPFCEGYGARNIPQRYEPTEEQIRAIRGQTYVGDVVLGIVACIVVFLLTVSICILFI